MGVEFIRDVPAGFELTEIQRRAASCVQTGEPWFSPELGEMYPVPLNLRHAASDERFPSQPCVLAICDLHSRIAHFGHQRG